MEAVGAIIDTPVYLLWQREQLCHVMPCSENHGRVTMAAKGYMNSCFYGIALKIILL